MPLQTTSRHHRQQAQRAARAVVAARGAWRLLDRHALDATSARYLARIEPVVASTQLAAATAGAVYVSRALAEQGFELEPAGRVRPQALAGVASDGRSLTSLLLAPVAAVKVLSARGVPVAEAMRAGRARLERMVVTQVLDAGRVASGVAVAATPRVSYVRMLNPPACSRCVILAGREYRYNAGFLRHPLCQCIHIPSSEGSADDERTNPRAYFDSLTEAEQDRIFGKAGAQAIRDGADMNQVVNARRGMQSASVHGRRTLITTEGTTRHGLAGRRLIAESERLSGSRRTQIPRLMPEAIYRDATSRDDAIRLLRRFGYITD